MTGHPHWKEGDLAVLQTKYSPTPRLVRVVEYVTESVLHDFPSIHAVDVCSGGWLWTDARDVRPPTAQELLEWPE